MERLHGLDLVRGLCAISVMIYHVLTWTKVATIDAMGTFGVYIFFVLSGCSLGYAYGRAPFGDQGLRDFFIARAFRIIPLYGAVVLLNYLQRGSDLSLVLLNVTLLFGFTNPGATSLPTGGWSIGIEAVFYVLFPILMLFRNVYALAGVVAASILINQLYVPLTLTKPFVDDHWNYYTQPVTFLCYFAGGVLISRIIIEKRWESVGVAAVLVFLAGMFLLPEIAGLSRNEIISGPVSLVMILASIAVVALAAHISMPQAYVGVSKFLGDISYSVYLLHPFVYLYAVKIAAGVSPFLVLGITAVASIVLSKLVYIFLEKPARDLQFRFRSPRPAVVRDGGVVSHT